MVAPPIQNGTHNPAEAAATPSRSANPQSAIPNPQSALPPSPNPQSEIRNPQSLPPLTPEDERLLEAFAQLHSNLDLLSEHADLPVLHLIRWLNQPHIRQYLEVIEEFRANQRKSEAELDRRAALDALKDLLATTPDPIEKRRAATTILRALNAPRPPSRERTARPAPTSDIPHPTSNIPHPTSRPSKTLSAPETLDTVLEALADDESDDHDRLATLHAFCAKGATIDNKPVPENVEDFIADLDEDLAESLLIEAYGPGKAEESTPTRCHITHTCLRGQQSDLTADITLERESPETPFLIKAIAFPVGRNTG